MKKTVEAITTIATALIAAAAFCVISLELGEVAMALSSCVTR